MSNWQFKCALINGEMWMQLDDLIEYFETDFSNDPEPVKKLAEFTAYTLRGIKDKGMATVQQMVDDVH